MHSEKNLLKFFLLLFFGLILLIVVHKPFVFKAIKYNFVGIDDYKIFENRTVDIATPQPLAYSKQKIKALPDSTRQLLKKLQTIGLVVIKQDSIAYEEYFEGYSDTSHTNSFSAAKSIVGLLIGCAIKNGDISSVNDPVGKYIPELQRKEFEDLKIADLLTMSSGTNWEESYSSPLSATTEAYYGSDIRSIATKIKAILRPGTQYRYKSGDTQLLGLILESATHKKLSQYASEQLWQPLGAEHPAYWSLDRENGTEKAYCCFNTNAKDFARIGQLMLDSGRWKGKEIIPIDYFKKTTTAINIPDETGKTCNYYGYQWWIDPVHKGVFYARGILGQYVIVIPSKKIVIVRLGEKRSDIKYNSVPQEAYALIEWGLDL